MILAIRIRGLTDINKRDNETLNRLRLRRKLAAVLIDEKDVIRMGMLKAVDYCVSYGKVDDAFVKELEKKRGQKGADGKLKPFFRLHPPIGGFKKSTKFPAPKGVLGKQKDITKLAERML